MGIERTLATCLLCLTACGGGSAEPLGSDGEALSSRALPPVEGPEPSQDAAIFYYPWYGNPASNGDWYHWNDVGVTPPADITSRYYPMPWLGAYSVNDAWTVAQHCAWLRRAGVGIAVLSWWGIDSFEDRAALGFLNMAARYRLKVAFHIEPYGERTADQLVKDIGYLNQRYGAHPAFYRTTGTSRHNLSLEAKGLFFLWSPVVDHDGGATVPAEYWRPALDAIHAASPSSLVIGHQTDARWVDGAHFDGLYNYGSLGPNIDGVFDFSMSLPPGAWYVPSVLPGAMFWKDPEPWPTTYRNNGATYAAQWAEALGTGVEPKMVTITSFNEWHEGTQIEPAAIDAVNSSGQSYMSYWPLAPEAYLDKTAAHVRSFTAMDWPQLFPGRIRMRTTSDWTSLRITSGAGWLRPETVSVSPSAIMARIENGTLHLVQSLADAELGRSVEITLDLLYSGLSYASERQVVFTIERGHLGSTTVTLWNSTWGSPSYVTEFTWGGINPGPRNAQSFPIPMQWLMP